MSIFAEELRQRKKYFTENNQPVPALKQGPTKEPEEASPSGAPSSPSHTSHVANGGDKAGTDDETISLSLEFSHE